MVSMQKTNELLEKISAKLDEHGQSFNVMSTKLSNLESRDSMKSGLENDMTRALTQYAMADSSVISDEATKCMVENMKKKREVTYSHNFYEKDIRRCEFEFLIFYKRVFENTSYFHRLDQNSQGVGLELLPSIRKAIHEKDPSIELPRIPEVLKLLYELALPMNRQKDPTTTEHLIKNKQVPEFFNNNNREMNAEQARVKWIEVKANYPLLSVIEQVPMKAEFEKHEHPSVQWCVRVVAYNNHIRQVVKATATSNDDEMYKKSEANQEEQKTERDLLKKKLARFWYEVDPEGVALIEKATKIKAEWAEAAMVIDAGGADVAAEQGSKKTKKEGSTSSKGYP
jgi:hypothetical protein